jgi:hypothetical protein
MATPDIFISYAHIDNEPFGEERARWVTEFAENLGKRLGMVAGDRPDVWRDPRLRGNDTIWPTIEEALGEALALVSVVSPRYISSDSCQREIAVFVQKWQERGRPPIGHRKPLFKVVKTFVPRDRQPQALRDVNGYEFYREDEATHRFREFGLDPDPMVNRLYWTRVDDLAQDIGALLDDIQREPEEIRSEPAAAAEPVCVYIAQTTRDVREARDAIARELKDRGVEVVPLGDLPPTSDELQAAVRKDLARARFSVHIVGTRDGYVPEGDTRSVVEIQYALALEGRTPGLLWCPPGLQPVTVTTTAPTPTTPTSTLGRRLALSAIPENGFDFLQGTLDEVKALLLARLAQARVTPSVLPAGAGLGVYMVHLRSDLENVNALQNELGQRFSATAANAHLSPLRFIVPIGRGTPAQLRMDHEAKLRDSDAVIVVCVQARRDWVMAKLTDLRRAGLASEASARAILYMPPEDVDLEGFPAAKSVHDLVTFLGEIRRA